MTALSSAEFTTRTALAARVEQLELLTAKNFEAVASPAALVTFRGQRRRSQVALGKPNAETQLIGRKCGRDGGSATVGVR